MDFCYDLKTTLITIKTQTFTFEVVVHYPVLIPFHSYLIFHGVCIFYFCYTKYIPKLGCSMKNNTFFASKKYMTEVKSW